MMRGWLAGMLLVMLTASPSLACPGDCNGDATVSISELIVEVNVALGATAVPACLAGDANGDGMIRIDELIAAVNAALTGCPADADAIPAAVLALLRAAAQLPSLADGLSVAIAGLGGSEACEQGRTLASSCEESGSGTLRIPVDADACRVQTVEGPHRYDGTVTAIADGQCPDVIEIETLRVDFDWRFVAEASDGNAAVRADIGINAALGPLLFGDPPCAIKGGGVIARGNIDYTLADGRDLTLGLADTAVAVRFFDFVGSCDPTSLETDVGGPVEVGAGLATGTVAATLDLLLTIDQQARTLTVGGTADVPAQGGILVLSTAETLGFPLGASCFTAGVLRIVHGGGTTELRFPGDGSVAIDRDGDGSVDRIDPDCL